MPWKNTIATDHTDDEPPIRGNTILVNIGCTANSNAALRKTAAVKIGTSKTERLPVLTEAASTRSLGDISVTLPIRSEGLLLPSGVIRRKPAIDRSANGLEMS